MKIILTTLTIYILGTLSPLAGGSSHREYRGALESSTGSSDIVIILFIIIFLVIGLMRK